MVSERNMEEKESAKEGGANDKRGPVGDRKLPWIKGTKYLLDFMFYCGIVVTASLPWSIRWIGELLPGLIRHVQRTTY